MSSVELPVVERGWSLDRAAQPAPARLTSQRLLPAISVACFLVVDGALVAAAFALAYWLRFVLPDDEASGLGLNQYLRMGLAVASATVVLLALHGLYDPERPRAWPTRLHLIASTVATALVVSVTLSFLLGDDHFSRLWFAAGWALAVGGLATWRALAQVLYARAKAALAPANRVLVVGANLVGQEVARELAGRFDVVGYVDNGSDLDHRADPPLLGPIAELDRLVNAYAVDEVVIALPPGRRVQVSRLITRGFGRRVHVRFVVDLGDLLPRNFEVRRIGRRPYIGFAPVADVTWLKRATDVLLGTFALMVLSPLMLAIAIAIALDSPGPVFYRQERVGKDGRPFWMFKFRSMHLGADWRLEELRDQNEASGPLFKMRRDPRATRVGRLLRRFSLDELPQLFNVLEGEMSLVGPRPPIPSELERYEDWQFGRLRAVPGMTGLWQVSGRSEVPFHDMVLLDLHYIRNWSLGLDLEILLRTVPAVLANRGAY